MVEGEEWHRSWKLVLVPLTNYLLLTSGNYKKCVIYKSTGERGLKNDFISFHLCSTQMRSYDHFQKTMISFNDVFWCYRQQILGGLRNTLYKQYAVVKWLGLRILYSWFRASWLYINRIQRDATVCRCLFTEKLLYMFRMSIAPIIRSTSNCNCSFWYRS